MATATFKIEKIKWSWPDAVEQKGVYRDDEFVRTATKEQALEAIDFLLRKPSCSHTYTITVYRDGEYFTYWRHSMPCLGGLVKYRVTHGERYFMNPYFPRDIKVMFPEGEIIFIAYKNEIKKTPLNEFMLSAESPWVSAFGTRDTVLIEKNYFVLTNMDTDPTVFYSLMRVGCLGSDYGGNYPHWDPKAQLLVRLQTQADPRRLAGQKPIRISGGTWAQGYGYTRPYNESIFKTEIPKPLKDFGHTGYGEYPTFDPKYFATEMQKQFKMIFSPYNKMDDSYEKALVEAWDYFKAKAVELGDEPGKVKDESRSKDSNRARKRLYVPAGAVLS